MAGVEHRSLRDLAIAIWKAGVRAVDAETLVRQAITLDSAAGTVDICGHQFRLDEIGRISVVGAGKAGAGMAAGVETALAPILDRVTGWVNVPENCVRELRCIHLHGARPAGRNEPTEAGVTGTEEILKRVSGLTARDVCLVLISGGGSALLPAPVEGVTLDEKTAMTRFLSQSGATIQQLNAVRRAISRIKGGGLARASRAGTTIALIISDVIGDPLDVIASGPTVNEPVDALGALAVLREFDPRRQKIAGSIWSHVEEVRLGSPAGRVVTTNVHNHVIGNNRVAVTACEKAARELGVDFVQVLGVDEGGVAAEIGKDLARECLSRSGEGDGGQLTCLLSGGEPVVRLNPSQRPRKGGRNQELALAALDELRRECRARFGERPENVSLLPQIAILSGGTDGEDGPTDAAGAVADLDVIRKADELRLDPEDFLAINNSYEFFEKTGGLLITGPTHTNVMDVRVALVRS